MSYESEIKSVILKALEAKEGVEAKETSADGFVFEAKNKGKSSNGFSLGSDIEISVSKIEGKKSVLKSVLVYDEVQNLDGFAKFSGEYLKQVL